ncbi:cyclin-g1-like isoform x2 [Plakobranchus ocellatus]|uniref:Cyclin-g1-like isoform x2 n=1 Tax=Plakobranchus ocellatus TaxID=259542 RepID=A0AAV4D4G6_9GAST|nr:cyclin-g1-like isoform x2 [Plakobranchus ocellatus]
MCLLSSKTMDLPNTIAQKLQSIMQRQSAFCCQLNLKDLSQAEFELYYSVREKCVQFIKVPHVYFGTQADTFAVAVAILDAFLWKVKVKERLMSIVSAACFFIASKMLETEETAPTAREIAALHCWTGKDLCRMELHILGRLGWHVSFVSYLALLPVLAEVYGLSQDLVLCDSVVRLAERFLCRQSTVMTGPAVLALALVQHVMGDTGTGPAEFQICVHCNIEDAQLKECKKLLSALSASDYKSPPASPPRLAPKFPLKIFDKPSMAGVTPLYTIFEEPAVA